MDVRGLWAVRGGVFVHILYRISTHHFTQGWSCPRAITQADFCYACRCRSSTEPNPRGNYTLPRVLTVTFSTRKCSEFPAIQAFAMKFQYMCTFLNLLQMSFWFLSLSNQTGFTFSLRAQTFLRQTVICEYTHCSGTFIGHIRIISISLSVVLLQTLSFIMVIVKERILLTYFSILGVPNHVCAILLFTLLFCKYLPSDLYHFTSVL